MGPNALSIDNKHYFDPRSSTCLNIDVGTGSRKNREMIPQNEMHEYLDSFSGNPLHKLWILRFSWDTQYLLYCPYQGYDLVVAKIFRTQRNFSLSFIRRHAAKASFRDS